MRKSLKEYIPVKMEKRTASNSRKISRMVVAGAEKAEHPRQSTPMQNTNCQTAQYKVKKDRSAIYNVKRTKYF